MSDDATSSRKDGPTPAGGAYSIAFFFHDGTPVPQRFANQALIVEYDDRDRDLCRTLGTMTPESTLPRDFVPEAETTSHTGDILFRLVAELRRPPSP